MTRSYWLLSAIGISFALFVVWMDENTFPSSAQAQVDDDPALRIPPSTTNETVPTTPYPNTTLEEQERLSREMWWKPTEVWAEPERSPLPGIALAVAVAMLALGELWRRGVIISVGAAISGLLSSTHGRRLWSKFWVWIGRISGVWTCYQIAAYFGGWA